MPPDEEHPHGIQGQRDAYALESSPAGIGGQAQVFRAVHKPTGRQVAFKRSLSRLDRNVARMKREIEIGRSLRHRNVMPVLDASHDNAWLVMPWADGNLSAYRADVAASTSKLRSMIESLASGLGAAHERGWIHRDVKPSNILLLSEQKTVRWVVSDWGLVRRPPGHTTDPDRTRSGVSFGTAGFAAPELGIDAHAATAAADVYSLGQVIGWAVTGQWPQPNIPLLPATGPWRIIVRQATLADLSRRPTSMAELVELIANHLDEPPDAPASVGEALVERMEAGDQGAFTDLVRLVGSQDYGLYIDSLPELPESAIELIVAKHPVETAELIEGYRTHLGGDWGYRPFGQASSVIRLLLRVARACEKRSALDLLNDAADVLFAWDGRWDQWDVQREIRSWLRSLKDEAARIVGAALRHHPESARHFSELAEDRRVNKWIVASLP